MKPHPHAQRCAIWPGVYQESPLGRHRRPEGISGPGERHQERVALGVDLLTVPCDERLAKQAVMFRQNLRVPAVAEALEERSRPLDVGEEEGDRPGRQAGHSLLS